MQTLHSRFDNQLTDSTDMHNSCIKYLVVDLLTRLLNGRVAQSIGIDKMGTINLVVDYSIRLFTHESIDAKG